MFFLSWRRFFLVVAAVAVASFLSAPGAAEETPAPEKTASEPPYYWTFPVPRDLMDVIPPQESTDPEDTADPFGDPFGHARRAAPRLFTSWKEHPDFFEVGAIQDASPLLIVAGVPWREG